MLDLTKPSLVAPQGRSSAEPSHAPAHEPTASASSPAENMGTIVALCYAMTMAEFVLVIGAMALALRFVGSH